jgi:hypothetical protein
MNVEAFAILNEPDRGPHALAALAESFQVQVFLFLKLIQRFHTKPPNDVLFQRPKKIDSCLHNLRLLIFS